MTTYQTLHWASLNFVKTHLYRRLATPLNIALGRIAIARHEGSEPAVREQLAAVEQSLEGALNLIKAWSALIHVQSGSTIPDYARRYVTSDALPAWLVASLREEIPLTLTFNHALHVHPETFYESLMIVAQLAGTAGTPICLSIENSRAAQPAVWVRAVFKPPSQGRYTSLTNLVSSWKDAAQQTSTVQVHVLGSLLKINGSRLVLQNNMLSGEQALAALLPAVLSPAAPPERPAAAELTGDGPAVLFSEAQDGISSPILSGPVLAPTPHDIKASSPNGFAEYMVAPRPLVGPVLAPTPRAFAPTGRTAPLKPVDGQHPSQGEVPEQKEQPNPLPGE